MFRHDDPCARPGQVDGGDGREVCMRQNRHQAARTSLTKVAHEARSRRRHTPRVQIDDADVRRNRAAQLADGSCDDEIDVEHRRERAGEGESDPLGASADKGREHDGAPPVVRTFAGPATQTHGRQARGLRTTGARASATLCLTQPTSRSSPLVRMKLEGPVQARAQPSSVAGPTTRWTG